MDTHQVNGFTAPAEGELVTVDAGGTAVAVTVLGGEVCAFQDTCPHAGCSLADGEVKGGSVVCPCHLARFDVTTGALQDGPATSGLSTWTTRLDGDVLQLDGPHDAGRAESEAPIGATSPTAPERDITVLIEREHEAFRRQFAALEEQDGEEALAQAWATLAEQLEIHASGEEAVLYPHVVRVTEQGVETTEHAVRDHNDIRQAIRAVRGHEVSSDDWWGAVQAARHENDVHLAEEERDVLPPLREGVGRARLEELGDQWLAFHDQHRGARGLDGDDADPEAVVEQPPQG